MTIQESTIEFAPKPTHKLFRDIEGLRFGRLTVLGFAGRIKKNSMWVCRCDCGTVIRTSLGNLSGHTSSCGCLRHDVLQELRTTHGLTYKHPLYNVWNLMRQRCNNPRRAAYADYGGRGIKVCERWDDFTLFLQDMGERPAGATLERKDNSKGYSPENCIWATRTEQGANKRNNLNLTYQGRTQTLAQWCRELGLDYKSAYCRFRRDGLTVEEVLNQ